ncbi:helix-turn-helix transcriptional regulator [Amycolatopsis sp. H20-H5]|uniref:helix-turn-helix transcriptional regulator n=1 Tax=Amycolatopsis sp. H20-H5 TaxID=3046309 RepID=UPI002DBBBF73|nr:LuxR C-terminal-related transcriptional regulator [Amycolatopsis sp. H20-H5]MEC3974210.1 LuxR C-terminal-related transcriptional regulator [Amycolatopsis sp. H20-H5]
MTEGEFVGRSAQLAACLERPAAGVTLVAGPPGIGKSRLLAEAARRAAAKVDRVVGVAGSEPDGAAPSGLAWRLVETLGGPPGEGPVTEDRVVRLLAGRETLVVVDDVHWADEESLRLLASLARRPNGGCGLLLSARDEVLPPAFTHSLRVAGVPTRYLDLPPFTDEEIALLLPGFGQAERDRIAAEAHRVPLYLLLLAELPAHTWPEAGTEQPAARDRPMLPLERVLFAEVSGLPERERLFAQAAVFCGAVLDLDLVRVMTELPETEVAELLERLLRRGVLVASDRGVRFRHPLVRAAARRLAGHGWRAGAHHRAAVHLRELDAPLTARAYHLEKALRRHDLVSVGELAVAGEEVLDTDPGASARWLSVALANLPERLRGGHEHFRLCVLHGKALISSGQPAQARAQLASLTTWPGPVHPEVLLLLARCERSLGRTRRARVLAEAAITAADAADEQVELELAHLELLDGDFAGSASRLRRLAAGSTADPAVGAAVSAVQAIVAIGAGRVAEAITAQRAAASRFDLLDDVQLRSVLDSTATLCWASYFLDDDRRALAQLDRAFQVSRACGSKDGLPHLHSVHSYLLFKLGRLSEAAVAAVEAETAAARFGHRDVLPMAGAIKLRILLAAGERTAAEHQWRAVEKLPRPAVGWWRRTVEQILIETGFELDLFPGALEPPADLGTDPMLASRLAHRCRVALAAGAPADAERFSAEAVDLAAATGLGSQVGTAMLARAACAVAKEDLPAALAAASSAAVAFGRVSMALHRGRAILVVADVLGRQGSFDAATQRIAEARDLFQTAGAGSLLREATRVQRQLAGRRKVNPVAGTDRSLSRRERQVAEMVVRGLATKEIAAELFLSPRTVDAHVGQVLRKLDLTSRAGIAHRLNG